MSVWGAIKGKSSFRYRHVDVADRPRPALVDPRTFFQTSLTPYTRRDKRYPRAAGPQCDVKHEQKCDGRADSHVWVCNTPGTKSKIHAKLTALSVRGSVVFHEVTREIGRLERDGLATHCDIVTPTIFIEINHRPNEAVEIRTGDQVLDQHTVTSFPLRWW